MQRRRRGGGGGGGEKGVERLVFGVAQAQTHTHTAVVVWKGEEEGWLFEGFALLLFFAKFFLSQIGRAHV